MFRVQVRFDAVRAWELSVRVLGRDHGILARAWASGSDSRAPWGTWKDASPTLRANNVCRNILVGKALLPIRRSHPPLHLLMHWMLPVQWRCRVHWPQRHETIMSWPWRGSYCLWMRMRHRHCALGHHTRRIAVVWLKWLLLV